eukprot:scaffold138682_cov127-Phaeocystis_antarctica.AAC.1
MALTHHSDITCISYFHSAAWSGQPDAPRRGCTPQPRAHPSPKRKTVAPHAGQESRSLLWHLDLYVASRLCSRATLHSSRGAFSPFCVHES